MSAFQRESLLGSRVSTNPYAEVNVADIREVPLPAVQGPDLGADPFEKLKESEIYKEFQQTQSYIQSVIRATEPKATSVRDWRAGTKAKLAKVKAQFLEWIDAFSEKFAKSVAALEQKRSTYDLDESDRQQTTRLENIRAKQ